MSGPNRIPVPVPFTLLFVLGLALATHSVSCQKKPARPPRPAGLELARASFAAGDCRGALVSMEELLAREGIDAATPEDLLSLVLCHLSGFPELGDRDRALELLRYVKTAAGNSRLERQAALLLELATHTLTLEGSLEQQQRRIRELEREVKGLKQIDTRPRSSRPPQ